MKKKQLIGHLIIQYFLTMTVPAFIMLFYSVDEIKNPIINFLQRNNFYSIIKKLEIVITILFFIIVPLVITIYNYYKQRSNIEMDNEELLNLIICIGDVVDEKTKRYYSYPKKEGDVFLTYIRPDIQIAKLKTSLTAYYRTIYEDRTITSDFFYNDKGNLIYECKDEPTLTSIDVVNNSNSTAKTTLKQGKMIIIPDTTKKDVPFVVDKSYDIKSILCYPIFENGKIKYIICISSKNKGVFTKENREKYEFVLSEFEKRIKLETYIKPILELSYGE